MTLGNVLGAVGVAGLVVVFYITLARIEEKLDKVLEQLNGGNGGR